MDYYVEFAYRDLLTKNLISFLHDFSILKAQYM